MSTGLCPFAVHKLLPETDGDGFGDQPRISPRIAILHSAAGYGSLYGWFRHSSNLESQFWISLDGVIEQYGLTTIRCDANLYANSFAVSIETESSRSATEPWTEAQVKAIIRLLDWLCREHPAIRRQLATSWNGTGIGWHTMWGSPSNWTPVAKSCPGPARIVQTRDRIIPAVASLGSLPAPHPNPPEEIDMTPAEMKKLFNDVLDERLEPIQLELADVRSMVTTLKRHTVVGAEAAKGDDTVPDRIIDSLARIESAVKPGAHV